MSMKFFGLSDKKVYTEEEQEHVIRQIDGTMSLEGMPLTDDDKDRLRDILSGRKTPEQSIEELKAKWRRISIEKGGHPK